MKGALIFPHRFAFILLVLSAGMGLFPDEHLAFAQTTFQRTYGGTGIEYGYSVQQTSDSGYIVAGFTSSFGAGSEDVYLVKTSASGDTLWTRTYGGIGIDYGHSVRQTSDGGYIIAGQTISFGAGSFDVYLVKTDASGDTLWTRTYGDTSSDYGQSVQLTSDGGYLIAGGTRSFGAGSDDVYLVKTNASGDTLWTRTYGGTVAFSVQQTSDSGYVIAGRISFFPAGSDDVYLVKTNASGDTLWTRTYGGTNSDVGYSVQQTSDGGYVIAGGTRSFGTGSDDMYLVKTNASGDTLWTRTYGGTNSDVGYSVQQTSDGGYIIAGSMSFDLSLVKTGASGEKLWTRTYGGAGNEYGYSVQQTSDGGYIVAGSTYSFITGSEDVYLVKTKADGLMPVQNDRNLMPTGFALLQNYPNPCNPTTTIAFSLPSKSFVSLKVFDVLGKEVSVLLSEELPAGNYSQPWNPKGLASGVYFYRLRARSFSETKKLVLLR